MSKKYRLYSFVNHLYMSPIQWGIQTAHCVSTMMSDASKRADNSSLMLYSWADEEPTIIVCQGGNVAMLAELYNKLGPLCKEIELPLVKFHEDEASLGGVITAVAVLVPEELYSVTYEEIGTSSFYIYDEEENVENPVQKIYFEGAGPEFAFIKLIKLAKLA